MTQLPRESILKLMNTCAGEAVCDMLAQANMQLHDLPSERLYELLLAEFRRQRWDATLLSRSLSSCAMACNDCTTLLQAELTAVSFQH